MENELIERYIYAVTRHLPQKTRGDIGKELDSLIADMLEERCGDRKPAERDIRIVLMELGSPEEMTAKYSGDGSRALISGIRFYQYKRLMKLVLPLLAVAIFVGNVLAAAVQWNHGVNPAIQAGTIFFQAIGNTISGAVWAFAIVTIVFIVLERKKSALPQKDFLSDLPLIPKEEAQIKSHHAISGMIWPVAAAVVLLGIPQVIGWYSAHTGWVPVFNIAVLRAFWLVIVAWAAIGIAQEAAKLMKGQFTKSLAVLILVTDCLKAACVAVVLTNGQIMNPAFLSHMGDLFGANADSDAIRVLTNLNWILLLIVLFGLVCEVIRAVAKAWKTEGRLRSL